ncbi:MAG: MBL fold metallo-hydrolase [Kiritimatiellaeota bacterium]|nr:MBL fold metallo-hydrolase [Kiritimatiellota bacterium]
MEISVLASGSGGNAVYVEASPGNGLLVDAGVACKTLRERLAAVGRGLDAVRAVLVTHDHTDHCKGLPVLSRQAPRARMFATEATAQAVEMACGEEGLPWTIFDADACFEAEGFGVRPLRLPHDAAEPLGFVLEAGGKRACVITDLGHATERLAASAGACHTVVLEFNHDELMLRNSGRPKELIRRISSPRGHLSNNDAGTFLERVVARETRRVILAHLSGECNTPALAFDAARAALARLGRGDVEIVVASQDAPTPLFAC